MYGPVRNMVPNSIILYTMPTIFANLHSKNILLIYVVQNTARESRRLNYLGQNLEM